MRLPDLRMMMPVRWRMPEMCLRLWQWTGWRTMVVGTRKMLLRSLKMFVMTLKLLPMPMKLLMPVKVLGLMLMILCCGLVGCATKGGDANGAASVGAHAKARANGAAAVGEVKGASMLPGVAEDVLGRVVGDVEEGTGGKEVLLRRPIALRGPDGRARVLVGTEAIFLQRAPGGPLERLEETMEDDAEKMMELAEGVKWSPRGTRVALLRLFKRGSGVAVYSLAAQPAAEVEVSVSEVHDAAVSRAGAEYGHGRFYYDKVLRWIDEDHLEMECSGNLVLKSDGDPANGKGYSATVRVELGAKTGNVVGAPVWGAMTD
ncbi:hypothetical protein [Prosthecobacter sp.]|uniref:hypothetical protein n=1 Tax=Prosthecobacter sp. TaxID=1965333 RepID=UPI00378507F3